MGGEPTIHPDFEEIMYVAQQHFERVTLFTNGINEKISLFSPREKDGINYNFLFSNKLNRNKLLTDKPGNRTLELLVTKDINIDKTKDELLRVIAFSPNTLAVSLTFDCTANIFKEREILIKHFTLIQDFLEQEKIDYLTDHSMPICFVYGSKIPIRKGGSLCGGDCAGMIDSECQLHFCNQFSNETLSIYEKGNFLPYSILENHLTYAHLKNQIIVLEKICLDCPYYNKYCNGGCFMASEKISKEDVLSNTQFPISD